MKNKILINIIKTLLCILFISVIIIYVIPFIKGTIRKNIIKNHLSEINTCVYSHKDEDIDLIELQQHCTEGFLFIYGETRHKINYNELAERIKYKYPDYIDLDNKTLVTQMLSRYKSLSENVTGLDTKENKK